MKNQKAEGFDAEQRNNFVGIAVALGLVIIVSGLLDWLAGGVALGFFLPFSNVPARVSVLLYYVAIGSVAVYVGYMGLGELLVERRFSVEFLMAVAALGAAYLGFLFEGATVLFLYLLAEYFEGYIEDRARKTVEKLSAYMPDEARVVEAGSEKTVNVKQVKPGATILVRPGERIPLDSVVVDGSSFVDQSILTGESTPIRKKTEDELYAGTLNIDGVLRGNVANEAEDTLVSRIARLVMQSRKRRASMERLVDRFARVYVPAVLALSAFVALGMPWIAGGVAEPWIYRSLILLVVSCPSAFIISVPAAFFTAIATAARRGIIIKGGVYLEKLSRVKAVVFDKTGTLTLGQPAVQEFSCSGELNDEKALMYAAALERYSHHPLADSIVRRATALGLGFQTLSVSGLEEVPGEGIIGDVEGCRVYVGSEDLMKRRGIIDAPILVEAEKHTNVFVSIDQCVPKSFCLVDQVRTDASETVKKLRRDQTYSAMLTGDRVEIAEEVAGKLGINEVYAELLPEEKLKILEQIRADHGMVAMVGDGVNDAPALAASDVGIAMGGGGVDLALETADIVLVKNELTRVPYLQRLSRFSVKVAKQNIVSSLAVKIALGVLGFAGLIPLWFAVAAGDDGVTILLLLNTLRIPKLKT